MYNCKHSQKFLLAVLVFLLLAAGMFLGSALFGQSLLMVIFGFLVAGALSKILDRGMKPIDQRQKLDGYTIMQTRLWWLFLLGMWDGTYRVVMTTTPSAFGKTFILLTFALTFIIPILKLAMKPTRKAGRKTRLSLNL